MTHAHFHTVFEKYYQRLVYFAHKLVGDGEVAKDLASDGFLKLWQSPNEKHDNVKSFLYTCVANGCRNYLLHEKRVRKDHKIIQIISPFSIRAKEIQSDLLQLILKEIDQMPASRAKIFKMMADGFSIKEISSQLSISQNTIRVQIKRVRDFLKLKFHHQ